MINLLIIIVFILSVATASGGILITAHLRASYKSDIFSSLIFFQVFYFTFGFYAIWGQLIVSSYLSAFVSVELLPRIRNITILLGSPFLILQFLMLMRFSREVTRRKMPGSFITGYMVINILILGLVVFTLFKYQDLKAFPIIKYYYILLNLIFTLLCIYNFLSGDKKHIKVSRNDLINLSVGIICIMIIQNIILLIYKEKILIGLLFILAYFISGIFIPVYIRYKADLSKHTPGDKSKLSFEQFCKRFEISKRETEIIFQICKGLTNQEIADKLFISLQTVKDHTHRIYTKTACSSRSQLIRIVNDYQENDKS